MSAPHRISILVDKANCFRYEHLDNQKNAVVQAKAANPNQNFAASLQARVQAFGGVEKLNWIYGNDVSKVWSDYLEKEKTDA